MFNSYIKMKSKKYSYNAAMKSKNYYSYHYHSWRDDSLRQKRKNTMKRFCKSCMLSKKVLLLKQANMKDWRTFS